LVVKDPPLGASREFDWSQKRIPRKVEMLWFGSMPKGEPSKSADSSLFESLQHISDWSHAPGKLSEAAGMALVNLYFSVEKTPP